MLFSFLAADRRRTYCLYEAPSPDAIVAAAERAGLPADVVIEVDRVSADMYVRGAAGAGYRCSRIAFRRARSRATPLRTARSRSGPASL